MTRLCFIPLNWDMTETTGIRPDIYKGGSMEIMPFLPERPEKSPEDSSPRGLTSVVSAILSSPDQFAEDVPCCGPPAGPSASPHERPGYRICSFVEGFMDTAAGFVPRVRPALSLSERVSTVLVRCNVGRNTYTVAPGLYAVGNPDKDSPVLVTANYKLTFDHLRKALESMNVFILVLDTRGINVWCAAGKKTFGTDELVNRIRLTGLSNIVAHRRLIVPQLGAVGVSAIQVKKQSGFSVTWGPVNAKHIPRFIGNGMNAEPAMRRLSFSVVERAVLVPVELSLAARPALWFALTLLVFSGFGPGVFSFSALWHRGLHAIWAMTAGLAAGAVLTPVLLPHLPGTRFSVKGALAGSVLSLPVAVMAGDAGFFGATGLVLMASAVSSWLAMNFTGATPFTSPSGVEKEMRQAMPLQVAALATGLVFWLFSAF